MLCSFRTIILMNKHVKAGTHQADFKELASTKANSVVYLRRQHLNKKAVLEHTAQTTAGLQTSMCVLCLRERQGRILRTGILGTCLCSLVQGGPKPNEEI